MKAPRKILVPQSSFVNSQEGQLQAIIVDTTDMKPKRNEII